MAKRTILMLMALIAVGLPARASDWEKPANPTKLDMLVLDLNARFRTPCYRPNVKAYCIEIGFIAKSKDTVLLFPITSGDVPLAEYETEIENTKKLVIKGAESVSKTPIKIEVHPRSSK